VPNMLWRPSESTSHVARPMPHALNLHDGRMYMHTLARAFTPEHEDLIAIWAAHDGDFDLVAAALPAHYCVSINKLRASAPRDAKAFAWQCVEGKYTEEGAL